MSHPEILLPLKIRNTRGHALSVPDTDSALVHLQFRRFAGCPICNLHLASFVRRQQELRSAGIREVIFFHSDTEELSKYHDALPFDLIADPTKTYYRKFGVEQRWQGMLHPRAIRAAIRGIFAGRIGRNRRGSIWGLPADFLISAEGRILATKYGSHASDHWEVDDVLALRNALSISPSQLE